MSKKLREALEDVFSHLQTDNPYFSPDAESKLIGILGYAVTSEGEKITRAEWYKR